MNQVITVAMERGDRGGKGGIEDKGNAGGLYIKGFWVRRKTISEPPSSHTDSLPRIRRGLISPFVC